MVRLVSKKSMTMSQKSLGGFDVEIGVHTVKQAE